MEAARKSKSRGNLGTDRRKIHREHGLYDCQGILQSSGSEEDPGNHDKSERHDPLESRMKGIVLLAKQAVEDRGDAVHQSP